MKTKDTGVYYDGARLIGYGAPVNIVIGERSEGKTYYFKRRGIKQYLKTGATWVYCRRYNNTLKAMLDKHDFFGDITRNQEFEGIELRVDGRTMQLRRGEGEPWEIFGYFTALSQAQTYKGTTDASCTMLVYDEFINDMRASGYLPNEPTVLMNYWETLDRREDRVKIFMLANAADMVNPFFLEWGIVLDNPGFRRYRNGMLVVQWDDNPGFAEAAANSNIGKFTAGTGYDDYARGNIFIGSGNEFVEKKPSNARAVCALLFKDQVFGIWKDAGSGHYYVTRKAPSDVPRFSLTTNDHRPNLIMLEQADPFLKALVAHYRFGMLFFDRPATREAFMNALRMLGRLR